MPARIAQRSQIIEVENRTIRFMNCVMWQNQAKSFERYEQIDSQIDSMYLSE